MVTAQKLTGLYSAVVSLFEGHGDSDSLNPRQSTSNTIEGTTGTFQVVVIGAGQAGLSRAGRLTALGMEYVLLEEKSSVGYGLYGKFDSIIQYTIREYYNNLPFDRTWLADDPLSLSAASVVEGFVGYVKKHHIYMWLCIDVKSFRWDRENCRWKIEVREKDGGKCRTLVACHLALALGAGQSVPSLPKWPGAAEFKGELLHSSKYKNSSAWQGKHGIVVGTGTTAHDIAQDMCDAQLSSITMVQRNKTAVWPIEWLEKGQSVLYNSRIPTAHADAIGSIFPEKITRDILKVQFKQMAQETE
ncbi:MAG: hypothetical protein M1831_007556 [Alyxoria varia]|nr:MAG: hypothetical protein M1831_007556 [Alyxoria varia]